METFNVVFYFVVGVAIGMIVSGVAMMAWAYRAMGEDLFPMPRRMPARVNARRKGGDE